MMPTSSTSVSRWSRRSGPSLTGSSWAGTAGAPSASASRTTRAVCRPTAGQALVPALDQTRTVGLVTLPGAFVGVLLGGGSAVQAGATQLVVLVALLAVEATAVAVTIELVARRHLTRPGDRDSYML